MKSHHKYNVTIRQHSSHVTPPPSSSSVPAPVNPSHSTPASPLSPSQPPSSSSFTPSPTDANQFPLIRRLNEAISRYPLELLISLATLEGLSFTAMSTIFKVLDIHFPTLFAVAFVVSMPLRRSVIPKLSIALPVALVLRKLVPSLAQVHLSGIWKDREQWLPEWIVKRMKKPASSQTILPPTTSSSLTNTPSTVASTQPSQSQSRATQFAQRLSALSDHYGLALLIGYRLAGCVIVNAVFLALHYGIDISSILANFGYFMNLGQRSVVGSYAGAVVFGSILFPITVFLAPIPAKLLFRIRQRVFGTKKASKAVEGSK